MCTVSVNGACIGINCSDANALNFLSVFVCHIIEYVCDQVEYKYSFLLKIRVMLHLHFLSADGDSFRAILITLVPKLAFLNYLSYLPIWHISLEILEGMKNLGSERQIILDFYFLQQLYQV